MEHWAGVDGVAGFRNGDRTAAHFHSPRGMCSDGRGGLVVVDSGNACLRRIDASGAQLDPSHAPIAQLRHCDTTSGMDSRAALCRTPLQTGIEEHAKAQPAGHTRRGQLAVPQLRHCRPC